MSEHLLEVKHLKTQFLSSEGAVKAVDDVSLSLSSGEVLGLVGESGSGKSVTGFSIMGLIDPPGSVVEGQILFKGQDLRQLSAKAMRQLRGNRIAMIFQDPMMTLNPVLRIDTQMIETLQAHESLTKKEAHRRACEALSLMGIANPEERLKAYPHQLSGGMRQRVAIATALLLRPDIIIADEPTTALDVTIQAQIISEVQKLCREFGMALIWITHDLSVVSGLADNLAVMYAGKIIEYGTVDEVLDRPAHPYTQGLINSLPTNNKRGSRLSQISGITPSLLNLPPGCRFAPRCERTEERCLEAVPELTVFDNSVTCTLSPMEEVVAIQEHKVRCFFPSYYTKQQEGDTR